MDEDERQRLLKEVRQKGATIGHQTPEQITVQGREMNLREFVFETRRQGAVPQGERERAEQVKRLLKRERQELARRLEEDTDLSVEEGEELVDKIIGIDRALNALKHLSQASDYSAKVRQRNIESSKQWVSFVDQILGQ
jgi:hypothetical protein